MLSLACHVFAYAKICLSAVSGYVNFPMHHRNANDPRFYFRNFQALSFKCSLNSQL